MDMEKRLEQGMQAKLLENRNRLKLNAEIMKRISPINKLGSGFSYVQNEEGQCLKDIEKFQCGDKIQIHVSNGMVTAKVLETKRIDRE